VFETLDLLTGDSRLVKPPWNISSGARSVHLIARFGEKRVLNAIRKCLNLDATVFNKHTLHRDSWLLIKEAAKKTEWQAEVLILSAQWVIPTAEPARFYELHRLLFKYGWSQSATLRNASVGDGKLEPCVSQATEDTDSIASLHKFHVFPAVRQLLAIAQGETVAFEPIIIGKGERLERGPFRAFQRFLIEYRNEIDNRILTSHFPIILQPCHLTATGQSGFFSLSKPSTLAVIPRGRSWPGFLTPFEQLLQTIHKRDPDALRPLKWDGVMLYGAFPGNPGAAAGSKRCELSFLEREFALPTDPNKLLTTPTLESDELRALRVYYTHEFFTACVKVVRT
jgi:hypothetical protein